MAKILDGKKLSTEIRGEVKQDVVKLKENGIVPGLAGILVGQDEGSATYVRLKEKAAEALGIHSQAVKLPEDTTEEQLLKQIDKLNLDSKIHGIFIQLPLPKHINENRALNAVLPEKDVDGFHPMNVGKAWLGQEAFLPATPDGISEILVRYGYSNLKDKHAVMVSADNLVGKPMASILVQENVGVNVTLCHPSTPNLSDYTRQADILVVSVNKARFITADMVKEGVIAIDFGANYIENPVDKTKRKLVGDIDFEKVKEKAGAITPVPGGVGPMTITMLLCSTVKAAKIMSHSRL